MFSHKKWFVMFAMLFLSVSAGIFAPEDAVKTAAAATKAEMTTLVDAGEQLDFVCADDIWKEALEHAEKRDLALMSNSTDHIVNYHGERFAITEDDYQVLVRIVEAEAGGEDIKGRMLVANVVLNRLELGFGGRSITDVVFAKGQFSPIADGRFFTVTPSETTIEAVERVLDGEDYSEGALYFMCRPLASKRGKRWFDKNLKLLFKHGCHEFYVEKD